MYATYRLGGRAVATTLRPRSGKEYYKIDRSILVEQGRILTTASANYANITPVLEKSESPSPGYMSSSPFEQPQPTREHFLFPEVSITMYNMVLRLNPLGHLKIVYIHEKALDLPSETHTHFCSSDVA